MILELEDCLQLSVPVHLGYVSDSSGIIARLASNTYGAEFSVVMEKIASSDSLMLSTDRPPSSDDSKPSEGDYPQPLPTIADTYLMVAASLSI